MRCSQTPSLCSLTSKSKLPASYIRSHILTFKPSILNECISGYDGPNLVGPVDELSTDSKAGGEL